MSYYRFMGTLRALARAPPLSLGEEAARELTSYSLRRKLPTVADRLRLPQERRAELGDWKDEVDLGSSGAKPAREPMAVWYSDARLRSAAETRLLCVWAVEDAARGGDEEGVRGAAADVLRLTEEARAYLLAQTSPEGVVEAPAKRRRP